jgi:hypothetical protein
LWNTGKRRTEHVPILIDGAAVEQVESFKFLGVHITYKLTWSKHAKTVVKQARQSLFPLRILKRCGMGPHNLKRFYSCTIESIVTGCITALYGDCAASDRKALQRVVRTAQYITGVKLPAIQDLSTRQCQRKALQRVVHMAQYITGVKLPAIQDLYTRRCQRKALKMVKTPANLVIDCSLCYRTASGTGASSLGSRGF